MGTATMGSANRRPLWHDLCCPMLWGRAAGRQLNGRVAKVAVFKPSWASLKILLSSKIILMRTAPVVLEHS